MATITVRLTKRWSDWGPGDVVALPKKKAERIIAKGYGHEDRSPEAKRIADYEIRGAPPARHETAENAMLEPEAERPTVFPPPALSRTPSRRKKRTTQKGAGNVDHNE